MIHRIDRVNPDIDDRVIKPNEARAASNLRFGASVENTNLSGGILLNGNEQLQYAIPAGDNLVVGVMDDFEAQVVYFALYNSNGNHAIYLVRGSNNSIERIVRGSWLNFNTTMNVSMAAIDGKLYWTDNVNQPRMVNVAKGIRTQKLEDGDGTQVDTYPFPAEEWYYTQIKRQPGVALDVSPKTDLNQEFLSASKENRSATQTGWQYSYYYVYDNNENSCIAPYTSTLSYVGYNVTLTIPADEVNNYIKSGTLIKAIVFIVRDGNDSPWNQIRYVNNDANFNGSSFFTNMVAQPRTLVTSDITDARFDSVPFQSISNEIAQNRLNHANYIVDFEDKGDISFEGALISLRNDQVYDMPGYTEALNARRNFLPWGQYSFGVEFVDKFGRTNTISNTVDQISGFWIGNQVEAELTNSYENVILTSDYSDLEAYNKRVLKYKISGTLPDWAERINIVQTRAKNILSFTQTAGYIFLWYRNKNMENRIVTMIWPGLTYTWQGYNFPENGWGEIWDANSPSDKYTFQGYAIRSPIPTFPFNYDGTKNQYIYIKTGVSPTGTQPALYKLRIAATQGSYFFVRAEDSPVVHPQAAANNEIFGKLTPTTFVSSVWKGGEVPANNAAAYNNPANYIPLLYNFVFTIETNVYDETFYATGVSFSRQEYLDSVSSNGYIDGLLLGENRYSLSLKTNPFTDQNIDLFNPGIPAGAYNQTAVLRKDQNIPIPYQGWFGEFLAMNPIDIFYQDYNLGLGQINLATSGGEVFTRQQNAICFSSPIIQSTNINGLNKFNSVDFRQAPLENGPITSLVTTNATQREPGVLLAIGTYGISSFYYDSIQLTNVDGESNITTTDKYLASQRPLLGQMGCSQPASITRTPLSTVYWWSDIINDFVRYTNAGLERIGLLHSFGNLLRKNLHGKTDVVSIYDQVTDEVSVWSKTKPHYAFSERFKSFQGERDYSSGTISPERGISLSTKMFHFFNGQVWVTDVNSLTANDNQFFGDYKNPALTIISNQSPAVVKQWNQIKVYGPKPISTNLSSGLPDNATANTPLLSYISDGWWIERKSDWEAAIRRAYNTPGGVLGGKLMESRILYSIFAFDPQKFTKLNFIEVKNNSAIVQ